MTTLLGPAPCHGCQAPVSVVRRPVLIGAHTTTCGHRRGVDGYCTWSASAELTEIVSVETDGNPHRCTERRPTMSRGATGAIPTRRYHPDEHIGFPATGDATPPSLSTPAAP